MDFLDRVYSWIEMHTLFSGAFNLGDFVMVLLLGFPGLLYSIRSFNYPLFPRRGTFSDAMDVIGDMDNSSGHKSMILDLCLGLFFLGFIFTDFILYSLIFMGMLIGVKILGTYEKNLKRLQLR